MFTAKAATTISAAIVKPSAGDPSSSSRWLTSAPSSSVNTMRTTTSRVIVTVISRNVPRHARRTARKSDGCRPSRRCSSSCQASSQRVQMERTASSSETAGRSSSVKSGVALPSSRMGLTHPYVRRLKSDALSKGLGGRAAFRASDFSGFIALGRSPLARRCRPPPAAAGAVGGAARRRSSSRSKGRRGRGGRCHGAGTATSLATGGFRNVRGLPRSCDGWERLRAGRRFVHPSVGPSGPKYGARRARAGNTEPGTPRT